MAKTSKSLAGTKRLMGALVRMKPKPHEDMKIKKTAAKSKRQRTVKKSG